MLCRFSFEYDPKVGQSLTVRLLIPGCPGTLGHGLRVFGWSSSLGHKLIHGFHLGAGHWWTSRGSRPKGISRK